VGDKYYEIIEHTADIGIRVRGKDSKELFKNAGLALFQISTRKQFIKDKKHTAITVKQNADNLMDLFVNWLNELLSLSAAKSVIFHDIKIKSISNNSLEAIATGSSMANYKVNTEIKAATYHDLKIEEREDGWVAKVILDV